MAVNNPSYIRLPKEKFGIAIFSAGTTSIDVSIDIGTDNYVVFTSTEGTALQLFITNKTSQGFTINAVSAPFSEAKIYWYVKEII